MLSFPSYAWRRSLRWLPAAAIGVTAYVAAMLVSLPAGLFIDGGQGTVWRGAAPVLGGHWLQWRWQPLRSVMAFGFAARWQMDGLNGEILYSPAGIRLEGVSGMADLAMLDGEWPLDCSGKAQVDVPELKLGGFDPVVEGRVRLPGPECEGKRLPPMLLLADGARIRLVPQADQSRPLLTGTINPAGRLHLRVTEIGQPLLAFLPPVIETQL